MTRIATLSTLLASLSLIAPGAAHAASATTNDSGRVAFWPGGGEANRLSVWQGSQGRINFKDDRARIVAKGDCVQYRRNYVRCPVPVGEVRIGLGSRDDRVRVRGAFDTIIRGGNGSDRIQGGRGEDAIRSQAGDDDVRGHDGNDVLDGRKGNDVLRGGDGDDRLRGRDGADDLQGRDGNDYAQGDNGDDTAKLGDGDDRARGGDGDDTLDGRAGEDFLTGGDGDDTLEGGEGSDRLDGRADADDLRGEDGDDRLDGAGGNDVIRGGDDEDELDGGFGEDRLEGRDGDDLVVSLEQDGPGQAEPDTVRCSSGDDRVRPEQRDVLNDCETVLLWNDGLEIAAQPRVANGAAVFSVLCVNDGGCKGSIVLSDTDGPASDRALGEREFSLAEQPDGSAPTEVSVELDADAQERLRQGTLVEVYVQPDGYIEAGPGGFGYRTLVRGG